MTAEQMETRIKNAYPDSDVVVVDTTGTQDHFEVRLMTSSLKHLSRIKQHQAVMQLFAVELKTGEVHALEIKIVAPPTVTTNTSTN